MSIFSKILGALGLGAHAKPMPDERPYGPRTVPIGAPGTVGAAAGPAKPAAPAAPAATPAAAAAPKPISDVDVVAQLEKRAAAHKEKLNWRTSIVDLMKLLDMDSSLSERKALATELGCPANLMDDSASMNMWLHKEVLKRIAANGGNVPANLLD
jgi:hypothetical protein